VKFHVVVASLLLLAAAPATSTTTAHLTMRIADFGSDTPIAQPLVMQPETRNDSLTLRTVRIAIDPPPAQMPHVTFRSNNPAIVEIATPPRPDGNGMTMSRGQPAPEVPGGSAVLRAGEPGIATVTASVGAPYHATLRLTIEVDAGVLLGCMIGETDRIAIDAGGLDIFPDSPGDADVYVTADASHCGYGQHVEFPRGAVAFPAERFGTLHASDWRDEMRRTDRITGAVLIRSHDGGIIELGTGMRQLRMLSAPAGGDFPTMPAPTGPPSDVVTIASPAVVSGQRVSIQPLPDSPLARVDRGAPIVLGFSPRVTPGFEGIYGAAVTALADPTPYAPLTPTWRAVGPIEIRNLGSRVELSARGVGRGSISAELAGAVGRLPVLSYPVVRIGCDEMSDGYAVAFHDDGSASIASDPASADFFISTSARKLRCPTDAHPGDPLPMPTPFTPGPAEPERESTSMYFPYGGILFPDARTPGPGARTRGVDFTAVTSVMWRPAQTQETREQQLRDFSPCMSYAMNYGTPIAGCTQLPDAILLLRTRNGRYVKLRLLGRGGALYAVSRADGTFAY
jgi:hypothetical protein